MNIGIIGLGRMGSTMAETINRLNDKGIYLYAVASTNLKKAEAFKEKYHAQVACGSGDSLIKRRNVDLVYIATPHSYHEQYVTLALYNLKPVLCEKPFTTDYKKAERLLKLAKRNETFVAEAMWTRYMPSRKIISELLELGVIGDIKAVRADLSYNIEFKDRMLNPIKGGGVFLDLGVYPIHFVSMFVQGDPIKVEASCITTDKHLDESDVITLIYPNNIIASITCSMSSFSDKKGIIQGTKGYIEVDNINNPLEIKVFLNNSDLIKTINIHEEVNGYEYELLACKEAIEKGLLESPYLPHSEILRMHKLYDLIRHKMKIIYPFDSDKPTMIN